MKKILACFLLLLAVNFPAAAQKADDILGYWLNADGEAKVQVYKSGKKYYGKIVWLKNPNEPNGKPKTDKNNSDNALKGRPIIGLVILTDFVFDDDEWDDGKIYDPKNGKTYSCVMKLKNGKLDIRGYVGVSLFGRTTTWTRTN